MLSRHRCRSRQRARSRCTPSARRRPRARTGAAATRRSCWPKSARSARSSTASAHQTIGDSLYNCFKLDDDRHAQRVQQARDRERRHADDARRAHRRRRAQGRRDAAGHLRDHGGRPAGGAASASSSTLQPGDAVLVHTGWGRLWGKDNEPLHEDQPGPRASRRPSGSPGRIRCSSAPTRPRST